MAFPTVFQRSLATFRCRATGVDLRGVRRRLGALAVRGAEVGGLGPKAVDHRPSVRWVGGKGMGKMVENGGNSGKSWKMVVD